MDSRSRAKDFWSPQFFALAKVTNLVDCNFLDVSVQEKGGKMQVAKQPLLVKVGYRSSLVFQQLLLHKTLIKFACLECGMERQIWSNKLVFLQEHFSFFDKPPFQMAEY